MNFSQTRIAVFGGRKISDNIYQKAYKLGGLLAKEGYLVYCGGGKGVMEAISKGVSESGGTFTFSSLEISLSSVFNSG